MTLKQFLIPIALFCIALYFRFGNLTHSFWVDEFSTASQARIVLQYSFNPFFQNIDYFESHNITTHFITAALFHFFGESEFVARLPSVFFGSLVPVLVYILGRYAFSLPVGLAAAGLTTASYWLITWSGQARGYALQQVLLLIVLYLYFSGRKKGFTISRFALLLLFSLLGLLTHLSFVFLLIALALHALYFSGGLALRSLLSVRNILSLVILLVVAVATGQVAVVKEFVLANVQDLPNNLSYYHSFLWREHGLISFLAFVGVLSAYMHAKTREYAVGLVGVIALYCTFFFFVFSPYVSRYLLPIFPLLLLFAAVALWEVAKIIHSTYGSIVLTVLVLFIIGNGDTFTMQKRPFYSVNKDMREIALLDYNSAYDIVETKFISPEKTALIDTWPDRLRWYMGQDNNNGNKYVFRWDNLAGKSNGLTRSTPYVLVEGDKILPRTGEPPFKLMTDRADLERILRAFPTGFIFIDDSSLSAEVREYAEKNMHTELYLDHHPLDENPYSIWPATLYSWGFESENPFYSPSDAIGIE